MKRKQKKAITLLLLAAVALCLTTVLCSCMQQAGNNSSAPNASSSPTHEEPAPPPAPDQSEEEVISLPQSPEELRRIRAEEILSNMSLYEKICQLFVVFPAQLVTDGNVTSAGESTKSGLEQYPVGGFIYDSTNIKNYAQLQSLLTDVQGLSNIPLFLTCDEEGGRVARVMSTVGTTWVDAMLTYQDLGSETAYQNALTIASDLRALGFNLNLAPVADVWSNPANTVIGDRAYSTDFHQAAELVSAAVAGFQTGGIACTLKHFPGHGDTASDSHTGAVYVGKTLDELSVNELLPFSAGIAAGADCVMIGHLIVSDICDEPATISEEIVTSLLREEMGFSGVIMTDSLRMQAITDRYSSGEVAVRAVSAGIDILLAPDNLGEAVGALSDALANGEISESRLNESVLRILELKLQYNIIEK